MGRCPYRDPFYRLMYYNLKVSLPDRMLVKVDRMSMAHSLEVRTPFLDHRLIELLVRVRTRTSRCGASSARASCGAPWRAQLPAQLLRAPKKGFAVPLGAWFRDRGFDRYSDGPARRRAGSRSRRRPCRKCSTATGAAKRISATCSGRCCCSIASTADALRWAAPSA